MSMSMLGWSMLVVALILGKFGGWLTFMAITALASFFFGAFSFFYSKTEDPLMDYYAHKVSRCHFKPGIRKIVEEMQKGREDAKLDRRLTGSQIIDETLQEIFNHILNDYIFTWWDKISADEEFVIAIREYVQKAIVKIAVRAKEISWTTLITTSFVEDLAGHIRLYRKALDKAKIDTEAKRTPMTLASFKSATQGHHRTNSDGGKTHSRSSSSGERLLELEDAFFLLEQESDGYSREFVHTSRDLERKHLEHILDVVLYQLLPAEDFNCVPARLLVREVLLGNVLLPLLDILTDPDYLNLRLIELTRDFSLSSEALILALKTTPNKDELVAIQEIIVKEINRLAETEVDSRQKLQSYGLNYVQRIIEARLHRDCAFEDKAAPIMLLQLNHILGHNLALSYFIDYLSTVDMKNHIFLYISIDSWKLFAQAEKHSKNSSDLRESARSIYDQFLDAKSSTFVPASAHLRENLFDKIIKRVSFSDSLFDDLSREIELKLEKSLRDFHKSNIYLKLLSELDLDGDQDEETQSPDSISLSESADEYDMKTNSNKYHLEVDITDCSVVQDKSKLYGLYAISVTKIFENGLSDRWHVYRRYSDFYDLYQKVKDVYSHLGKLPFPAKKAFNNMEPAILSKRKKMLNDYLKILLGLADSNPHLPQILLDFLEPGEYDKSTNPLSSTLESVKGSVRTVTAAVKTMPDNLFNTFNVDGLSKVFQSSRKSPSGPGQENDIPHVLLLLLDEVFDFQSRNQWFRRRIVSLFMFGDMINRKIINFVDELISTARVASYLATFKNSFWPGGSRAPPRQPRDESLKVRTRVVAKTALLSMLYDDLRPMLGSDTTRRGLLRLFALFQNRTLNRRFVHVLLERILIILFPSLSSVLSKLLRRKDVKQPLARV